MKDEIAVKDSQLIKFQEYHQILETNLNQEKEIKERLISEINTQGSERKEYEVEMLKQRVEQEISEKERMRNEIDQWKRTTTTPADTVISQSGLLMVDRIA